MAWFESHLNGGGGGGQEIIPTAVGGYSKNLTAIGTLSHTFAESGKYQYIAFIRLGDGGTLIDPVFKLNDESITPSRYEYANTWTVYYYGEITVEADDILSATTSMTSGNSNLQLFVFKNADLTAFETNHLIGFTINNSQSFPLPNDTWIFQVYRCGYYGSLNNFSYRIEKHKVNSDSSGNNYVSSIPTPGGDGHFYYGFTYALPIR